MLSVLIEFALQRAGQGPELQLGGRPGIFGDSEAGVREPSDRLRFLC